MCAILAERSRLKKPSPWPICRKIFNFANKYKRRTMIFSAQIQEQFAQAFGQPLRYPGDYEALAEDVCEKTGQPVSVNTLKGFSA